VCYDLVLVFGYLIFAARVMRSTHEQYRKSSAQQYAVTEQTAASNENADRGQKARRADQQSPYGDTTSEWALVVIGWQSRQTQRAADAASLAVRLAHRPYFDVKELNVTDNLNKAWSSDDPRQPPFRLSLSYKVYNASQTPAKIRFVGRTYKILGTSDDWSRDED